MQVDRPKHRRTIPPLPERAIDAHKGDCGRILVIAGSEGMMGAACLASMAALRAGAGLVTLALPGSQNAIAQAKCTEVVTSPLMETEIHTIDAGALDVVRHLARHHQAVVLGPGLGRHPHTDVFIRECVRTIPRPMVVDADGLNALPKHLELLSKAEGERILTPHPGELARLLDTDVASIQKDREGVSGRFVSQHKVTLVLKGHATVVCDGATVYLNKTGNPGMATAGSGDVLAGVIAALRGQGMASFDAAILGVYLHGLAGDLAVRQKGMHGLIAGDLVDFLPAAFFKHGGARV
jgi:NAD(P)H-hydrate epimerase